MSYMHSTSKLLVSIVILGISCGLGGCKKRYVAPAPPPPKDRPGTTAGYSDLCSGTKRSFTDAKQYSKHADGSPSKVVVFEKGIDAKIDGWAQEHPTGMESWTTYTPDNAELTACVEAKPMETDAFTCSYYGASVDIHSRDYHLRIIENATGKVLVDEKFTGEARTWSCPATVTGSKNWYVDYDKRLYGELFALQPAGTKPPKETTSALYAVCSGTPVPSAGKPGTTGATKVVYFNDEASSYANRFPDGIEDAADEKDVASYTNVICVTAKPERKRQSCDFYDKTLELYDGEFEVVVREARTAKVVETKSFAGTAGYCPSSHRFGSARTKKWMSAIDPSFKEWAAKRVSPGA